MLVRLNGVSFIDMPYIPGEWRDEDISDLMPTGALMKRQGVRGVIVREEGIEITNGRDIIASVPKKDEEFDLPTLSDFMVELKQTYPAQDAASVLMEAQIPYDYLIQVMDIVRSVEIPVEDPLEGEERFELVALFSEISVGDAP